jgi:hypothetical protein
VVASQEEEKILTGKEDDNWKQLFHGTSGYTTKVKTLIKTFGNQTIEKVVLKRTPISDAIYKALNVVSLGKFDKSNPYDKLFHLAMDLTFKDGRVLRVEKNASINMQENPTDKADTESEEVNNIPPITLNTMLERARDRMGSKYFKYNAKGNNCQVFIQNLLDGSQMGGPEDRAFVMQSTRDIFNKNPKYVKTLTQLVTNLGGKIDIIQSEVDKHRNELRLLRL